MSINIPTHFVSQFSTNIELLLQQKGSRLRSRVSGGTHVGKAASPLNQFGAIVAQQPAGRFAPLNRTDASVARRWVHPVDYEIAQLLDEFDMLRLIEDPKGPYAENAANAIGRAMDDAIITAALATSAIGETGTGTENFDTSNYSIAADFGAAGEVGMTVKKLIEARRKLRAAHVDFDSDEPTLVIGATQEANLLNEAQVASTDFNERPVLVDGKIVKFVGFNIVVSERLTAVSDDRYCLAFVKSGIYLGVWQDINTTPSQRNDLSSLPWQLHTKSTFGATRTQQGKVIRILADE